METMIEVSGDLLSEVEAEAARQQRDVRDLVSELVRTGLAARRASRRPAPDAATQWLNGWVAVGEEATRRAPSTPSATEILRQDRSRQRDL